MSYDVVGTAEDARRTAKAELQSVFQIPISLLQNELSVELRQSWAVDLREIEQYYKVYNFGADFAPSSHPDVIPSTLKFKKAASLINKEARFMFGRAPEVTVEPETGEKETDKEKQDISDLQNLLNIVLMKNSFPARLLQAVKDALVAKRIAIVLNFSEETGVTISFVPPTNFVYEFSPVDGQTLKKISVFTLIDSNEKTYFLKRYEMQEDGYCHLTEKLFNAAGEEIEDYVGRIDDFKTEFEYIPAVVVLNDPALGDFYGNSDLEDVQDLEEFYSRMANADMDAERQSMNPIYYTVDAATSSTQSLTTSPGSFWDIASDETKIDNRQATVGVIEPAMHYSTALDTTLKRLESSMYSALNIPEIDSEALRGVVTSGKTLKALYWSLIVRCEEKFLVWQPALQFISNTIIDGCLKFPKILKYHMGENLKITTNFKISVTNVYPLLEDEQEEKQIDIAEVNAQLMSRKSYMIKWHGVTPEKADAELEQIAKEKQLLEDSYFPFEKQEAQEQEE